MDGIKFPVEAKLEGGQIEAELQKFLQLFNSLGEAVAKANKLKFQPVDKMTVEQVKQLEANFGSLLKVSGELKKRLAATGQGGADFLGIDWSKTHPDQRARNQAMLKAFQYVTGGSLLSLPTPAPTPPPAPAPAPAGGGGSAPPGAPPSGPPEPPEGGPSPRSQYAKAIAQQAAGMLGPAGRVASQGIGAGLAGGGMLAVGVMAAQAVMEVASAAKQKIENAQQELIGYDTLKRQLGDVNVSFGTLQESLRNTARELDTSFDESLKHGQTFTKIANLSGDDHKRLADEISAAGGFGRSFGMDLGRSTAFFAQERLYGVTKTPEDSRRLGLLIGEGLARAGIFSKADDVLEAIASFTEQQTRHGMTTANVSGYASFLTGMAGSGIPGLDPASAASLLARVNASIMNGGSAGEAGQNFMFSALGSRLGLNPIQTGILREQGAFGTGAKTFGDGSLYGRFMDLFGGGRQASATARGSTATNLQLLMEHFQKNYRDRPDLMVNAMSGLFGTSMSQSMALAVVNKEHGGERLGSLLARLERLGVNVNDVKGSGISRLAQLEATLPEGADKDKRIKEAASQNQEETEGSKTRETIAGVERAVQKAATALVEPLNAIRAAVMYMAGESGKKGEREIMEAVARANSDERVRAINGAMDPQIDSAQAAVNRARERATALGIKDRKVGHAAEQDPERAKRIAELEEEERVAQERLTKLKQQKADALAEEDARRARELAQFSTRSAGSEDWAGGGAGGGRGRVNPARFAPLSPVAAAAADASAAKEGLNARQALLMKAIYGQESRGNASAPDSDLGAVGGMQMLPETFRRFADKGWDIRNPEHNRRAAARYIKYLWQQAGGNERTAAGAYYGGEGAIGDNGGLKERRRRDGTGPSTLDYADEVMQRMRMESGTPLPDDPRRQAAAGAASGESAQTAFRQQEIRLKVTLEDKDGRERAKPVETVAKVGVPIPAGNYR